ncbi:hypothetical protein ACI7BZ_20130 [Xanthobacter sp. AM11]|uniref:hypothetical protein n=1 Tax=Xanthobacter sp. AM11 TaxID=3380643 RepID=UPI0039BFB471
MTSLAALVHELKSFGPEWILLILIAVVLTYRADKILGIFLTHARESRRISAKIENDRKKLNIDLRSKLEKIEAQKAKGPVAKGRVP